MARRKLSEYKPDPSITLRIQKLHKGFLAHKSMTTESGDYKDSAPTYHRKNPIKHHAQIRSLWNKMKAMHGSNAKC